MRGGVAAVVCGGKWRNSMVKIEEDDICGKTKFGGGKIDFSLLQLRSSSPCSVFCLCVYRGDGYLF